jgi:hypothetical protein
LELFDRARKPAVVERVQFGRAFSGGLGDREWGERIEQRIVSLRLNEVFLIVWWSEHGYICDWIEEEAFCPDVWVLIKR